MPYFSITANKLLDTRSNQLKVLSEAISEALGKPESYVMLSLNHNPDMLFAGSDTPLAYCELKSLGLEHTQTADLSKRLCTSIQQLFDIDPARIYIEFSSPARPMWGWNNKTF